MGLRYENRFSNYCGLIKVAKGDVAPPDFLGAAFTEGHDVSGDTGMGSP